MASKPIMTGKQAVLDAFDRLFDRAAARLQVQVSEEEKAEARRDFAERAAQAIEFFSQMGVLSIPEEVLQGMEESIDRLSVGQLIGYLAALPLAHQAQALARRLALQAAQQRMLEQMIEQADDTYGGN
jgi:hypothetical protein